MNESRTFQVASTRFTIRCGEPSFAKWLGERCNGFVSPGEPHLRLNLSLDNRERGRRPGQLLSIAASGGNNGHINLSLNVACPNLADFFWPAFHLCLRCAVGAKHPPDLLLHSAGIVQGGMAYLFSGPSGIGKSTVCKLLADDSSYTILHDDVVALSQKEGRFYAWSTPPKEEKLSAKCSSSAPLRAVFFLKHDETNCAHRLSGRKAAALLALNMIPPQVVKNGGLGIAPVESLNLALALAEYIPCYELRFKPERSFWECIPPLFEKGSATTQRKDEFDGK